MEIFSGLIKTFSKILDVRLVKLVGILVHVYAEPRTRMMVGQDARSRGRAHDDREAGSDQVSIGDQGGATDF